MALVVDIGITAVDGFGGVHVQRIETVEIRRLEQLVNVGNPQHEVHNYRVTTSPDTVAAEVQHRYGDGARALVEKALTALREARA